MLAQWVVKALGSGIVSFRVCHVKGPPSFGKHELAEIPDERTEFARDGDGDFVAVQATFAQSFESIVQPVLCFPAQAFYGSTLPFLSHAELARDFGFLRVVLGTLD